MATKLPLDELSQVMGRIRGLLLTEEKVAEGISLLARAVATAIPGSMGAGASLLDREGQRTSYGSTDDAVANVDGLQYELNQGPCLSAWATGTTVRSDDLVADDRWPDLAARISGFDVRAVVSTPLIAGGHSWGALKVYADQPQAFDQDTERLLELFAGAAAILLGHIQSDETPHRISEALMESLSSRDQISRACGALMERHGVDAEGAMRLLLDEAHNGKQTLRQAAVVIFGDGTGVEGH